MSIWINKFTGPGYFFCLGKTHPKGNEYHKTCCVESGITYVWDIVEINCHPITMGRPEFETSSNMKMVGLMILLTRVL